MKKSDREMALNYKGSRHSPNLVKTKKKSNLERKDDQKLKVSPLPASCARNKRGEGRHKKEKKSHIDFKG